MTDDLLDDLRSAVETRDPDAILRVLRAAGLDVHVGYHDGKEIDRITSLHLIEPWVASRR